MMNDIQGQMCFNQGYRTGQVTSEIADIEANKKFKARHTQLVYTAVRCFANGGTAMEISKAGQDNGLKINDSIVHKRLSNLRDRQNPWLRNGDDRKCKISGREVLTWFII